MHLSNVQIVWIMFMRILMMTNQSEKKQKIIVFDYMVADLWQIKDFKP